MTTQQGGSAGRFVGGTPGRQIGKPADVRLLDRAYYLDLLGDSHNGLGRYRSAIEAYQAAAIGFETENAPCSYALCLFKIAESYLSLLSPGQAAAYLQRCLPLLRELGLARHEALALEHLASCEGALAAQT